MKKALTAVMTILLTVSVISTIPAAAKTETVKVGLPFLSFMDGTTQFYRLNPDSGELEGYAVDMFREIEKKDPSLSFRGSSNQIIYRFNRSYASWKNDLLDK